MVCCWTICIQLFYFLNNYIIHVHTPMYSWVQVQASHGYVYLFLEQNRRLTVWFMFVFIIALLSAGLSSVLRIFCGECVVWRYFQSWWFFRGGWTFNCNCNVRVCTAIFIIIVFLLLILLYFLFWKSSLVGRQELVGKENTNCGG